ncbi:MAG: cyclic nucleotide-binding domain-containing protein [Deltaproteobacteria bacterium]|nr:MAG: cyclic nucleotide-binding domain-containing protein [Deltaproteobacteria bacterium]
MIIQQADLFRGMSREFVKEFMDSTKKETFEVGDNVFREGEDANHFYILLKGRVRLTTGEEGQVVHTVDRPGEAFGWSSLVGRDAYSASAECIAATKVISMEREIFRKVVEKTPSDGMAFYQRLAGTVGDRLINSYRSLVLAQPSEGHRTYGSSLTLLQRSQASPE